MKLAKWCRSVVVSVMVAVMVVTVAACSTSGGVVTGPPEDAVTITLAGWTLSTRPEFQALADGYHATHPNVVVQVKEYSADDYDKQLIADLSAKKSTDVFPIKNLRMFYTYAQPGALADLSDLAADYENNDDLRGLDDYRIDGRTYAMPYRQDVWVLFYNKTLLRKLGLAEPNGTWTWATYESHCRTIGWALKEHGMNGVYPTYHHTAWQSMPQSIVLSQYGGDGARDLFFSGDYAYLESFYARMARMEAEGLTLPYNTISSSKTTYQSQFGTQKAVLLPMATWYMGPLADAQQSGDAEDFEWGITTLPQQTAGQTRHPRSFGDPTGFAIPATLRGRELEAAKDFLRWACGEQGALTLAKTGTLPAYWSQNVLNTFLNRPHMPQGAETRDAITRNTLVPENPVGEATQLIQDELQIAHTSIMSGTAEPHAALERASHAIQSSGLLPKHAGQSAEP